MVGPGCLPRDAGLGRAGPRQPAVLGAIAIHLADGNVISETAPAAGADAPYVENLTLNGAAWPATYVPAGIFVNGGSLDWTLGWRRCAWGVGVG